MSNSKKKYSLILLLGDLAVFYLSLFLALILRYRGLFKMGVWKIHSGPFLYVHILWILIFYIIGLYDFKNFASRKNIYEKIMRAMITAGILTIPVFYFVPSFLITPKTTLFLDLFFITALIILWRRTFWFLSLRLAKIKILFLGFSREIKDIIIYLKNNLQLGYEPKIVLTSNTEDIEQENEFAKNHNIKMIILDHNLEALIKEYGTQFIVVSEDMMKNKTAAERLYAALPLKIAVMNFLAFYEIVMEKIPVSIITEMWFLENINETNKNIFAFLKRIFDILLAVLLMIFTLAILPFIAIITKFTRGEVFYFQKRVGKDGKIFNLIKFGTMILDAEKEGVKWAENNDRRTTRFGKFLRKTRLDELPQLLNVLKGEMSFIGPRPERPEFVEKLVKEIPHYSMRHLVKPGLSGWAQIKLPHGGVGEAAMEKMQYDLYYIKNRSFVLDAAIALKTLAIIMRREGR